MFKRIITSLGIATVLAAMPLAQAAAGDSCNAVRFNKVNWTGVSIKTATAAWLLDQLGYKTDIVTGSVPIVLKSLSKDDGDAFLGLWIPSQRAMARKYMRKGEINVVTRNLDNAKYTVAVSKDAWDHGIKNFHDLAENADKFDHTIFGIEAGNEGNGFIKDMIKDDAYGMSDFELKPSSEAGMLAAVKRRQKQHKWSAWLGWAPHPMTLNIDMKFLNGGAKYFGPNQGAAAVYTISRKGYAWQCPNIGQFLENFKFTVEEQSLMDDYVINKDMSGVEAGREIIKKNPELLDRWFGHGGTFQTNAIKTADGSKEAGPVIKKALGL